MLFDKLFLFFIKKNLITIVHFYFLEIITIKDTPSITNLILRLVSFSQSEMYEGQNKSSTPKRYENPYTTLTPLGANLTDRGNLP